ncbi:M20/M25/M40 family metallo-hydrolase [Longimicrobium sp.]|uniref:M20/M25/M40 family metallo-hydrolase n=1 Tax=Longimicrobium sp. TaxID=2029185 RepID=UPI002E313398|nr:M20/M25/M40 family metallo-hydrolase [Longimicrobium sp.]HEX6039835.1 M20/M25/M40 family metallo-hydrolase [Longimicrobium sp.]
MTHEACGGRLPRFRITHPEHTRTATLRDLTRQTALQPLRRQVHQTDDQTLAEQIELVRIPAPPFAEEARGAHVLGRFGALGLADARRDEIGNVLGTWAPEGAEGAPVVVAAHLDTVFPAGTRVEPRTSGKRIHAPGITDNCRGLAGMLAVARILAASDVRAPRPVLFAATVGEEGIGDLRGVKHMFREGSPLRGAAAFIALDGSGLRRIVHRAIGSRRLRIEIAGPGGHSWSDRGVPNPVAALGSAIAGIGGFALPHPDRSALTVARVGGGTSVNAIPEDAWMELDMRSEVPGVLGRMEDDVRAVLARAVEAQNTARRNGTPPLRAQVEIIGDRPSGETTATHPLVRAASLITGSLGAQPELVGSSTDANVPMALGIPSIAIGAGGDSGGIHTLDEWYANDGGALGVERALLVVLAAAGV